jgi:hypothetical protein
LISHLFNDIKNLINKKYNNNLNIIMDDNKYIFEVIKITNSPIIIFDKRWYFRLVNNGIKKSRSLMQDYDLNKISNHLVVCYTPHNKWLNIKNDKYHETPRLYAFFDSYVEFLNYIYKFDDIKDRNFYEMIFGEFKQKPHFDIDIDIINVGEKYHDTIINVSTKVLDILITTCIETLNNFGINIIIEEDILIYSSHCPTKQSFHLVINNYCHDSNIEARAFYDIIIKSIKDKYGSKYIEFIDKNVYSSKQQFRILGSQKINSDRPKILNEIFTFNGIEYTHKYPNNVSNINYTRFFESMITHTFDCKILPFFTISSNTFNTSRITSSIDISQKLADMCLLILIEKFKLNNIIVNFTITNIKNNIIVLHRHKPSYCPLCKRIHENQHPFMFINSGKLYWDCRRYNFDKYFVGYIDMDLYNCSHNITNTNIDPMPLSNDNLMIGDFYLGSPSDNPTKISYSTHIIPTPTTSSILPNNTSPTSPILPNNTSPTSPTSPTPSKTPYITPSFQLKSSQKLSMNNNRKYTKLNVPSNNNIKFIESSKNEYVIPEIKNRLKHNIEEMTSNMSVKYHYNKHVK